MLKNRIRTIQPDDLAVLRCAGAVLVLAILLMVLSGCVGGIKRTDVVKAPDAPMLINEVKGKAARVSVYDRGENELVEYGWINLGDHAGWTLSKFDWAKIIRDGASDE